VLLVTSIMLERIQCARVASRWAQWAALTSRLHCHEDAHQPSPLCFLMHTNQRAWWYLINHSA